MNTNDKFSGFTLIELLIVIAILGVLISLALPNYQNYMNKAKFSEVITATAPYKLAVEVAYQTGVKLDNLDSGKNGIPENITENNSYKYTKTIQLTKGVITATSKDIGVGEVNYILTAKELNGRIIWDIDNTSSCLNLGLC